MNKILIKKKDGKSTRLIYLPDNETKTKLRSHLGYIDSILKSYERNGKIPANVLHGFIQGRSPVTNASQHVGYEYTLSMDLSDFFDSVTEKHLSGLISEDVLKDVIVDGSPRQGLPSSPAVCNIAAINMDIAILRFIKKRNLNAVYTRYADDLSFSFNEKELYELIKSQVIQIAGKCGFRVNAKKTRLQWSRHGLREVTGVMVGSDGISVSRAFRRRIRAARHQGNDSTLAGMLEWQKLKAPNPSKPVAQMETFKILKREKKVSKSRIKTIHKLNETRQDHFLITNDLGYMLGMTDLAEGWTSCYRTGGCNSNAPYMLANIEGVSVGLYLSEKTVTYNGLTRNKILARCIIYETEEGNKYAKSFYGGIKYTEPLKDYLTSQGITVGSPNSDERVKGFSTYITSAKADLYGGVVKVKVITKKGTKRIRLNIKKG